MTTLTVLAWNDPRATEPLRAAGRAFSAAHPDCAVHVRARTLADFDDQPVEQAAAAADLLLIDYPMIPRAATTGSLAPLHEPDLPPGLNPAVAPSCRWAEGVQHDVVGPAGGQPATAAAWRSLAASGAQDGFFAATAATTQAARSRPAAPAWPEFQLWAGPLLREAVTCRASTAVAAHRGRDDLLRIASELQLPTVRDPERTPAR